MKITKIIAREIIDSRGWPTVETKVVLDNGQSGTDSVPSGASTGTAEALELRDGDKTRFQGKGVLQAVNNVNKVIAPKLIGQEIEQLAEVDKLMIDLDGTENKSNLGANAILSVSLASARALANARQIPLWKLIKQAYQLDNSFKLPIPTLNVINGGRHADSGLDIQEFMIVPQGLKDFRSQFRAGVEIYHVLKKILLERGYTIGIGDEGGFAPHLAKNELAFEILVEAINQAGYQPGKEISLAIDAAASEFYQSGSYLFEKKQRTAQEMVDIYQSWLKKYPLISIEDGLSEDDWSNWSQMMVNFKKNYPSVISVGDDLFVTNQRRLQKGIDQQVANAILIKLNQIGSLSETIACIKLAQQNNYRFIISHRSGETNDDFITDLAVATGADFIKTGAPQRGERLAKYNRLLQIENEQNK